MATNNFDFGGFIDDDNPDFETEHGFEEYLSVKALLQLKLGKVQGRRVYDMLEKIANETTEENGGRPGILFSEDGGEFVSFHDTTTDV